MKIQDYIVANHRFRLVMSEMDKAWERLQPYHDFMASDQGEPLFCVDVKEGERPEGEQREILCNDGDGDEPRIDLYQFSKTQEWHFQLALTCHHPVCAHIIASEDFKHASLYVTNPQYKIFSINNALMLLYAFNTAPLGTLEMHASVVVNQGKGYLFLGKSGTGKSTHSSLWLKYIEGSWLLNDDNPILQVDAQGTTYVYGSPWSGKTPCYKNLSAPVGAIVKLSQAKQNVISRLPVAPALAVLYGSSSGLKWDSHMADGFFTTYNDILSRVPIYHLDCLPDEEAARVCAGTVKNQDL